MMTVLEQLHLCMIKKFHVAQVLHRLRDIYFCSKYLRCFQSLHSDMELPVYINPLPVYICKAMN